MIRCIEEGITSWTLNTLILTLPDNNGATCPAGEGQLSRRDLLKLGAFGLAASTLGILEGGWLPERIAHAAPQTLPDIQYDITSYIAPAQTIDGVLFQFGPVHGLFLTAQLNRTPTKSDQKVLADALNTIESTYAFSPSGIFSFISYGLPYFNRLPPNIVSSNMPRLLSDKSRYALEEAVPGPTDVSQQNPSISKKPLTYPWLLSPMMFSSRSAAMSSRILHRWRRGYRAAIASMANQYLRQLSIICSRSPPRVSCFYNWEHRRLSPNSTPYPMPVRSTRNLLCG